MALHSQLTPEACESKVRLAEERVQLRQNAFPECITNHLTTVQCLNEATLWYHLKIRKQGEILDLNVYAVLWLRHTNM